jgi:GDP-D-mannose dehydratase
MERFAELRLRTRSTDFWRLRHILDKLVLHAASLESFASIFNVVDKVQPDEIYHLAAQSFVSYSFEDEVRPLVRTSMVLIMYLPP